MTRGRDPRFPWPRPGVPLAGVLRRSRADRWALVLTVVVVALASALAVLAPRLVERTADEAVRVAVREAGSLADTTVTAPFSDDGLDPADSAADTVGTVRRLEAALPDRLVPVLVAPVATVVSRALPLGLPVDPQLGPLGMRLAWVWAGAEPGVTWVAGAAPGPPVPSADGPPTITPDGPPPYPVQIGLAEEVAAVLDAGVGDRFAARASTGFPVDLVVTGIFRADDPRDSAWGGVAELLRPRTSGSGRTIQTIVAGLLSAESLPAARLAVARGDITRTVTFAADAEAVDAASADVLPQVVAAMQAAPTSLGVVPAPQVTSRLGLVLTGAREEVRAAHAQAAVPVTGVVVATALTLLLTAQLLAHRRRPVLATLRGRGASLTAIGVDLTLESAVLVAAGGALGWLTATLLVPGSGVGGWLVPVLLAGLVTGPVAGVLLAAGSSGGRRVPANRHQRRRAVQHRRVRRVAVEAVVVALAVGTIATLRLRGIEATTADPAADLLLAAAPALGVAAGALVLLRLVAVLLRVALRTAHRFRGAVPLLAAVQTRSLTGRALPLVTLTVAAGLLAVVATLGVTVRDGQVAASWAAVGAEVTVTAEPDAALPEVAASLAARPGVDLAVPARVEQDLQLRAPAGNEKATLLAVDPAEFADLLATTPLPDAPDLDRLDGRGVPALVGAEVPLDGAVELTVLWFGERVRVEPVGRAPRLGGSGEGIVVVDAAALGEAVGGHPLPNTVWVSGAGAAAAVAATPELADASVLDRRDWLAERRADPLTGGLTLVAAGSGGLLVLLAGTTILLAAAAGAPARGRTLATLRTVGLTARQSRWISLGELLPPVLLAALVGVALGTGVAGFVRDPLALELLTGGPDAPELVVSWWVLLVVVPLALAVWGVVAAESFSRRRQQLGEVLRIG